MANKELWGLTLLERNLKQLDGLGFEKAIVLIAEGNAPRKHFFHPLPKTLETTFVKANHSDPFESLRNNLQENNHPVLVLEGHGLYDKRVLTKLITGGNSLAVLSPHERPSASSAVVHNSDAELFGQNPPGKLTHVLKQAVHASKIPNLDLSNVETYIKNLRAHLAPFLLLIEKSEHLEKADRLLRRAVHKGVNDFVAKYIHPPLEFAGTRLLAPTPVTPNQVTLLGIVLSILTVYLFSTGRLLAGAILAAIKGVLDGIDGKLARLTLRFSKYGDLLDHIGDTIFDGLWYVALGWHFSGGDVGSTAGQFGIILLISYIVCRIVPGVFHKLHGTEIYDYQKIDRAIRLVGGRINNNIWVFLIGVILGFGREAFYTISFWMLLTAVWYTMRLFYVTIKRKMKRIEPLALTTETTESDIKQHA
ncbi:MAG: CDP-alcohol phosphatidyltransferase family protein [bacterium]